MILMGRFILRGLKWNWVGWRTSTAGAGVPLQRVSPGGCKAMSLQWQVSEGSPYPFLALVSHHPVQSLEKGISPLQGWLEIESMPRVCYKHHKRVGAISP